MSRNGFSTLAMAAFLLLAGLGRAALAGDLETTGSKAADPLREARRLIEQLRAELKPVDDQIAHAPYLTALEHHQVSLDNLRAFVGEEYYISRSDLRSNSQMLSRFGNQPHAQFFLDNVNGEAQGLALLLDFARALGLSERTSRPTSRGPGPRPIPPTSPGWASTARRPTSRPPTSSTSPSSAPTPRAWERRCATSTASRRRPLPISTSSAACRRASRTTP